MDNTELEKLLLETPAKIKIQEKALLELTIAQAVDETKAKRTETDYTLTIWKDETYKNEIARKSALKLQLEKDTTYTKLVTDIDERHKQIKEKEIDLEESHNNLRVYLAIAGMVKA